MPVAAAVGAAAVGIGGSILSSKAQKKAANTAAQAQVDNTAANNALAREIYGKNEGYLSPYVSRGNSAGDAINALLGLGGAPATAQPAMMPGAQGYSFDNYRMPGREPYMDGTYGNDGGMPRGALWQYLQQNAQAQPQAPAMTPQQAQQQAFENFRNSSGYQFRLGQGMNAINSGYAASGLLQSGAAQKALLKYGQDYGSNEFGNYMGYLTNQQGVGLSGASALAGVGQNYVNNVSANNNSAADALSNAALLKGRSNGAMWGSIGNSLGSLFGSSFGG